MTLNWIFVGSLGAALAVVLGAFGAHALGDRLNADELALWETAARYLMYAALGLVAMGVASRSSGLSIDWPASAVALGAALFSGTVAALALGGPRWLGAVTPFGGALMILGWILFAWASLRS